MNKKAYKIRYADTEDAFNISELSRQLGYPASEFDIKNRLNSMMKSNDHVVYVATEPEGKVVGWIHVFETQRIESESFAEIGGLVVSEAFRCKGIGKQLIKAAENWTRKLNLAKLRVRSKLERQDAKKFYSLLGFSKAKQQNVFDKTFE